MIINIFTILGGIWSSKKAGSGKIRCVAGTAPALLQSDVRRHFPFIRRIISPYRIPLITAFECSFWGEWFLPRDQQV